MRSNKQQGDLHFYLLVVCFFALAAFVYGEWIMWPREAGLKGGRRTGRINRVKALRKYYANPNYCQYCGEIIRVLPNQQPADARRKKFCDHSCAAKYNNSKRLNGRILSKKFDKCERCGIVIEYKNKKRGGYFKRKYCNNCLKQVQIENALKMHGNDNNKAVVDCTKGELFARRGSSFSGRTAITKNARQVYKESGRSYICAVCGYDKHVEISHKKAIAGFSNDILIREINDIDNLVALCPNCHWEYDNGLLKL